MKKKAKESRLVARARKKLEERLKIEHQKFSPEVLQEIVKKIRTSIQRHHPEKNTLKERKVVVFDSNVNPAKTKSKQIIKLMKNLENHLVL